MAKTINPAYYSSEEDFLRAAKAAYGEMVAEKAKAEKQEKKHRTLDRIMHYVEHYFQLCGYDESMLKFISPLLRAMFEELDFEDEDSGDRENDGKGSGLGGHHTPLNSVNPVNSLKSDDLKDLINFLKSSDLINHLNAINPQTPLHSASKLPESKISSKDYKPFTPHKEPSFLDLLLESESLKNNDDTLTAADKQKLSDKI